MRRSLLIAFAVAVLAVLNYLIYEKQQIVDTGDPVLLELAPVDPRSLLQGDYMRLRYALERSIPPGLVEQAPRYGKLVIDVDESGVAHFARFHAGEALGASERLFPYHRRYQFVRIAPDSFLFQEGHAPHYERAKYAEFRFAGPAERVLVALRDAQFQPIRPSAATED